MKRRRFHTVPGLPGRYTAEQLMSPADLDAACRHDLYTFIQRVFVELNPGVRFGPNWHVEMMAAELQALVEGKVRRQIYNVPPRGLKSLCASIAMVAWALGHDATRKIMVVSYGAELADKLARDTRQIMQSDWYRRTFPATRLSPARQAVADFETTEGGGRMAVSFGGAITGRGADIIVIDDPIKPEDAYSERARDSVRAALSSTLLSRFNEQSSGVMALVMQRLHQEDLSAHLLQQGFWKHINLPAIAQVDETWTYETPLGPRTVHRWKGELLHPDRDGIAVYDELRLGMGQYAFAAQYLQQPPPLGDGHINLDWFARYDVADMPKRFDRKVQSWDTANKESDLADFSVCTTWGQIGDRYWLLAVDRAQMEYPKLKAKVLALRDRDAPDHVLIEDGASGQQLVQDLRNDGVWGVVACKPKGEKAIRLMNASSLIEGGFVSLPKAASWLDAYEHELASFPGGRHDDQVDSTSQALNWFRLDGRTPALVLLAREETRKRLMASSAEPTVRLQAPTGITHVIGRTGKRYCVDDKGVFVVAEEDLGTLPLGWTRLSPAEA